MKRKRYATEQIIQKLREAGGLPVGGTPIPEICEQIGVSEGTDHRWRGLYGGLKPKALKRLRVLGKENARLKKIVADQAMDLSILREVAQGKY